MNLHQNIKRKTQMIYFFKIQMNSMFKSWSSSEPYVSSIDSNKNIEFTFNYHDEIDDEDDIIPVVVIIAIILLILICIGIYLLVATYRKGISTEGEE